MHKNAIHKMTKKKVILISRLMLLKKKKNVIGNSFLKLLEKKVGLEKVIV